MSNFSQNYYDLLELNPGASLEEIRLAYQRAKNLYSPESQAMYSMFSEDEIRDLIRIIDEAYAILSNPSTRSDYDQSLNLGQPHSSSRSQEEDIFAISGPQFQEPPNSPTAPSQSPSANSQTRFGDFQRNESMEEEIANETVFEGAFLKKVREYKMVSIEMLSQHTKIGKHHLIAIEENDFSKLPALVFVRGFVKQYADLLGLNGAIVSEAYAKLFKQSREK